MCVFLFFVCVLYVLFVLNDSLSVNYFVSVLCLVCGVCVVCVLCVLRFRCDVSVVFETCVLFFGVLRFCVLFMLCFFCCECCVIF